MGFFIHPKEGEGFELIRDRNKTYLFFFAKPMYEFRLKPSTPLMYVDNKGQTWEPDLHLKTDEGSTPMTLQLFFPKDKFLASYCFHDSACEYGYLWMKQVVHAPFQKTYLNRFEANDLLEEMVEAEGKLFGGGKWFERKCIHAGVDLGAFWKYATRRIRK